VLERVGALRTAGLPLHELAAVLGRSPRTLCRWAGLDRSGQQLSKPRGRPAARGTAAERNAVIAYLRTNPHAGTPTLAARFGLGRRELEELKHRYRTLSTLRERDVVVALTWTRPGTVWAMDFTDAGLDVDGLYPSLLLVRDLASGAQLAAVPCEHQRADVVRATLSLLFNTLGPPLVIKSDNGAHFVAESAQRLLHDPGVFLLRSPPYTPRFNGACEAGIGSHKTHAFHIAAAAGRPYAWTCDDVERARLQANATARPWGPAGPTPDERWAAREPIAPELRAAFGRMVNDRLASARAALADPSPAAVLELTRQVLAGVLQECELLSTHLESIPARRSPRRRALKRQPEEVTSSSR
jgi:transposase InsO family protein